MPVSTNSRAVRARRERGRGPGRVTEFRSTLAYPFRSQWRPLDGDAVCPGPQTSAQSHAPPRHPFRAYTRTSAIAEPDETEEQPDRRVHADADCRGLRERGRGGGVAGAGLWWRSGQNGGMGAKRSRRSVASAGQLRSPQRRSASLRRVRESAPEVSGGVGSRPHRLRSALLQEAVSRAGRTLLRQRTTRPSSSPLTMRRLSSPFVTPELVFRRHRCNRFSNR